MTTSNARFLAVLAAAIRGEAYTGPLAAEDAEPLIREAEKQSLLPLVLESVYQRPELRGEALKAARSLAVQQAMRQLTQDNEFLVLLEKLQARGYDPLVLKGMVCRELYKKPFLRPSVDEDLLVPGADFAAYDRLLVELGMFADAPDADLDTADETSYHKVNSPLYIELHKNLFPPDSDAYGDCNRPFADVLDRTAAITVQGMTVRTLAPTDHLLYLLLHAFKHFLHSGFGIRQICDIGLFTEHYGPEIDMERVIAECRALRAEKFAAAIFRIGEKHLGLTMPAAWQGIEADEEPLLEDILAGGLYGMADENRLHSSNITLSARASGQRSGGLWHSLFPGAEYLRQRYPYAKRHPVLVPAAWAQRLFGFLKKSGSGQGVSAAESVKIGQARVKLLEMYDII